MSNLDVGDHVVHVAGIKGEIIRVTYIPIYTVRWDNGGYKTDCKKHDLIKDDNHVPGS